MQARIDLFLSRFEPQTRLIIKSAFILLVVALLSSLLSFWLYATLRYQFYWKQLIPKSLRQSEYVSVVVLSEQKNYFYRWGFFAKRYIVTTGSPIRYNEDRTLRPGVWRLVGKRITGADPIYGPRLIGLEYYNPYKNEFIKTQKAFHGTSEEANLGNPTSMGCVYHKNKDIVEIYKTITDNTLVIVTNT